MYKILAKKKVAQKPICVQLVIPDFILQIITKFSQYKFLNFLVSSILSILFLNKDTFAPLKKV